MRNFLERLSVRLLIGIVAMFCIAAGAVAGDLDAFHGLKGRLDIAGGTAHIPVMEKAAKHIMDANPRIHIVVAGGGSGIGIRKVGEDLIHIGNTGRAITDEERNEFGLISFPFAIDGVVAVVHHSNPVTDLRSGQVQAIFAGKVSNWKEIGGADRPIHVYNRDEASATREVFREKLLNRGELSAQFSIVSSNAAMRAAVGSDVDAIGYLSIGYVDPSVSTIAIDGVAAIQETAEYGTYKVVRKLYMNTKGKPSELAQAFIDYIHSGAGARIVREAGYIPIK
ncbi:MAG: phosphate ABC transporter substrate-binding protein [Gammaproteobacteria bacterium]|nr:phosphate ABC transporter substrate-binding protein [Gammaproteobacteria bacterium]NNJ85327.1 phosphate ABC transporter substrate-binding protein [Gammaproteobacteria bacterium]